MFYENVLALCKERGITVSKLEKDIGFGNATVRGWEKSSPRLDSAKAVADYFGVSVDSLLKGGIKVG